MERQSENKLSILVEALVGKELLQDKAVTRLGWVALANMDHRIGPKFLISFNNPTKIDEFDYIFQFSRLADRSAVRDLYSRCNGMKVFGNFFSVPGVGLTPKGCSGLDFFNIPYDFQVMGGVSLPAHSPSEGFVIGVANIIRENGSIVKEYSILDQDAQIECGFFDEAREVISDHQSIEAWLESQIVNAKNRYLQYLSR